MHNPKRLKPYAGNKSSHECVMMFQKIPTTLKGQFKAACAKQGVTMQHKIIQLMRQVVIEENR